MSCGLLTALAQYTVLLVFACAIYYLCHFPNSIEQRLVVLQPAKSVVAEAPNGAAAVDASAPPPPPAKLGPSPQRVSSGTVVQTSSAAAAPSSAAQKPVATWRPSSGLPPPAGKELRPCVEANAWDNSHFSADRDWVLVVDGRRAGPDTLWRWVPEGGGGHLLNKGSKGHVNSRPGGFVRGHGNRPPWRPAPRADSTALIRTEVPYGRFAAATETRACAWAPAYYSFKFQKTETYLHVEADGGLASAMTSCSDEPACLFALEPVDGMAEWSVVRSVLTGGLLRMVGDEHPVFDGYSGLREVAKAAPKPAEQLAAEQEARARMLDGTARCPVRGSAPSAWEYNASDYAPLLQRALAPWYDGGVSATALDLAFWHEMYPYANRYERPSLHLSIRNGVLGFRWQPSAPRAGQTAAVASSQGEPPAEPPADSEDAAYISMVREVMALVRLPDVEWVAHTAPLPKVPGQNLELVLAPATDPAHNDVPAPSPHHFWGSGGGRVSGGGGGGGGGESGSSALPSCPEHPSAARRQQLLLQSECRGSVDGYRGPLWRFYAPHRAALLAATPPLLGRIVISAPGEACTGPAAEGLALEAAWDAKAAAELRAETRAAAATTAAAATAIAAAGGVASAASDKAWASPEAVAGSPEAVAGSPEAVAGSPEAIAGAPELVTSLPQGARSRSRSRSRSVTSLPQGARAGATRSSSSSRSHLHPCAFAWELILDGQGPPHGLLAALSRGATVLRQASPYEEAFTRLLVPWTHFVPVADNLADLAEKVAWLVTNPQAAAHIASNGQRLARRLHRHELACIWWQLLSALAPLEDFVPRTAGFQRVRMGDGRTSHAASASYTTIRRRRRASRRDRLGAAGRSRNHSK